MNISCLRSGLFETFVSETPRVIPVSMRDKNSRRLRNSTRCRRINYEGGVCGADEEPVEPAHSIFSHCSSPLGQSPASEQSPDGGTFLPLTLYLQPVESD